MPLQIITANLDNLPRNFSPDVPAGRVETGSLQINDDWPGVFFRGDTSAYFAMQLDTIIDALSINNNINNNVDVIAISALKNLSDILKSCLVKFDDSDDVVGC